MALFKKYIYEIYKLLVDIFLIFYFMFKKPFNNKDFLILTGSDSTHFNSLINLLKTLKKHEKDSEVIVINLGMQTKELQYIKNNFKYEIKNFNFIEAPDFVSERDEFGKLGSYAWKPISIFKEFNNTSKNIIWLDAGCLINKNLKLLKDIIRTNGFYSPQSSDNIARWSHKETLKKLQTENNFLNKRNISGGIVGFSKNSQKAEELLTCWHNYSITKEVIAPEGSSRLNHRQDQTILSVLIHKMKISTFTPRTHLIFGILRHQDNENDEYL